MHFTLPQNIPQKKYDFIFLGTGCATLSLLMRMIKSNKFSDKKILLIDKATKNQNDRTWCFWEKEKGFFEDIVYNKWDSLNFYSHDFSNALDIAPYQYKMIQEIDFYDYCFRKIKKHNNIETIYGESKGGFFHKEGITLKIDDNQFELEHAIVFNSILNERDINERSIQLLQHFKGWVIETDQSSFKTEQATLMDFRVRQNGGTTFCYVLPFSDKKALVEYTQFTKNLLERDVYDKELKNYIENILKITQYKICEQEFGIIPMTNAKFEFYKNDVYHIGTAGGQTKASTGYTFQFIQKQSERILNWLLNDASSVSTSNDLKRFRFYDTVLLRLLSRNRISGEKIFSRLFQRNKAAEVFKFLDNETSMKEELKIIRTLPTLPFLKAAIH